MTKGCIYYTDNKIDDTPIFKVAQRFIKESGLPIVSTSLKPIDFGTNIVVEGERSYPTMVKQILTALENSTTDYVFFTEHDVLYPKSHFDFTPPRDDIFYYNSNVWRWFYQEDTAITHDRMLPLSSLCVNKDFALDHYRMRMARVMELGLDEFRSREPRWARRWGYEPGTKKIKRGGFTDDDFETWRSEYPIIDVRHTWSFSRPKIKLSEFKHEPKWWKERPIEEIEGWDLKSLFNERII